LRVRIVQSESSGFKATHDSFVFILFFILFGAIMNSDPAIKKLLARLFAAASRPHRRQLKEWVWSGILNDPAGEFAVAENRNPNLRRDSRDDGEEGYPFCTFFLFSCFVL
jgi:hypothetical protein